jgi:hypothetical protein
LRKTEWPEPAGHDHINYNFLIWCQELQKWSFAEKCEAIQDGEAQHYSFDLTLTKGQPSSNQGKPYLVALRHIRPYRGIFQVSFPNEKLRHLCID